MLLSPEPAHGTNNFDTDTNCIKSNDEDVVPCAGMGLKSVVQLNDLFDNTTSDKYRILEGKKTENVLSDQCSANKRVGLLKGGYRLFDNTGCSRSAQVRAAVHPAPNNCADASFINRSIFPPTLPANGSGLI